jgi:subtilase family serine protease
MRRTSLFGLSVCLSILATTIAGSARAQGPRQMVREKIDETRMITLTGNVHAAARSSNDRGRVNDEERFEHLLILLKRDPDTEAALKAHIEALHNPASPEFHKWLSAEEIGSRFGVNPEDSSAVQQWLRSHGFTVNQQYKNGLVLDVSASSRQIREAFHTEMHDLVLPNGDKHVAAMRDPQIPAALEPVIAGVTRLHDFRPQPRLHRSRGQNPAKQISFDTQSGRWKSQQTASRFNVPIQGFTFNVVAPFDFATIYNLTPLWQAGFTGKGVTIALIEDTDVANPQDWTTFRKNFGMTGFTHGNFKQVFPGCKDPGANSDEDEAALDIEWSSAAAPDASVELVACGDTKTTSGLDRAILGILDSSAPPDIISISYGGCETLTGQSGNLLSDAEAELATAEGVTYFIAQGDTGADECAPFEATNFSILGITSGDNTAATFAVDVGGTDFLALYNSDVNNIPTSNYWGPKNDPKTKASALSYIPETPWNDGCTARLVYTDPFFTGGGFTQSFGNTGFCNTQIGSADFGFAVAGGGGPSTCFTGTPSTPGVVGGSCRGNPKPSFQHGVPGIPNDGLRDQPDISLFAGNALWGSFYPFCLSDTNQGGTTCTAQNDAVLLGGGGTSFSSPAMAGIQALINQRYGNKQGDTNFVYYELAAQQFAQQGASRCNASQLSGKLPAASCVFNDVTFGDITVPCGQNPDDGKFHDCHGASATNIGELTHSKGKDAPAYPATVGYDFASGLGSVNAASLFKAWAQFADPH